MMSERSYIDELIKILPIVLIGCYAAYTFGFVMAVEPEFLPFIQPLDIGIPPTGCILMMLILFFCRYCWYKNSVLRFVDLAERKAEAERWDERLYISICSAFGQKKFLSRVNSYYLTEIYPEIFIMILVSFAYALKEDSEIIRSKMYISILLFSIFFILLEITINIVILNKTDPEVKIKLKILIVPVVSSLFLGVIFSPPSKLHCQVKEGETEIFSGRVHIMPNLLIGQDGESRVLIRLDGSKFVKCLGSQK